MTGDSSSHANPQHRTWPSLKRDVKRALGLERYEVGWVKTGEKSRVGRFAETQSPVPCEDCGSWERYFHLEGDHVTYPFALGRDRLVCHECMLEHRGVGITTNFHPEEVFVDA